MASSASATGVWTWIETLRFADDRPACRDASQSGPMLVIDGDLHPRVPEGQRQPLYPQRGRQLGGRGSGPGS